jgi:hypothetical protein
MARYRADGGSGLVHKARGRTLNRSINSGIRQNAIDLVKSHYADFGPTLVTEALEQRHGIRVGRETLRSWLLTEGLSMNGSRSLRRIRRIFIGYGVLDS